MSERQFSWIPAYEAIATALLGYEERQAELCSLVEEIIGERYEQMDPLTFFSMFNGKRRNTDKRIEAVKMVIDRLGLDVVAPADFDGLPITNPQRWRYLDARPEHIAESVGPLWDLFRVVLALADTPGKAEREEFVRLFDSQRARGGI